MNKIKTELEANQICYEMWRHFARLQDKNYERAVRKYPGRPSLIKTDWLDKRNLVLEGNCAYCEFYSERNECPLSTTNHSFCSQSCCFLGHPYHSWRGAIEDHLWEDARTYAKVIRDIAQAKIDELTIPTLGST